MIFLPPLYVFSTFYLFSEKQCLFFWLIKIFIILKVIFIFPGMSSFSISFLSLPNASRSVRITDFWSHIPLSLIYPGVLGTSIKTFLYACLASKVFKVNRRCIERYSQASESWGLLDIHCLHFKILNAFWETQYMPRGPIRVPSVKAWSHLGCHFSNLRWTGIVYHLHLKILSPKGRHHSNCLPWEVVS